MVRNWYGFCNCRGILANANKTKYSIKSIWLHIFDISVDGAEEETRTLTPRGAGT